jgi:hypothetical protein
MPPSVKFKSKMFFPTPRYAAQRGVDFCRRMELNYSENLNLYAAHESGDPEVQFDEKKPEVDNLVRLSL